MTKTVWSVLFGGALALASSQAAAAGPPTSHPPHPTHPAHPQHVTSTSAGAHGNSALHAHGGPPATPPGQARQGTAPTTSTGVPTVVPRNPKLAARLAAMLPTGMTLDQAADGFKNQGQFIASLHVSQNLGIPFEDLKTRIVTDGMSLGDAITALKPSADSSAEVDKANSQARDDQNEDHDESPK